MSDNKYTNEQVIDAGLEIAKILMDFCSKTGESDLRLKKELTSMDDEHLLHSRQQNALQNLSEISASMNEDATAMINSTQKTSSEMESIGITFGEFSDKVLQIAKNGDDFSKKIEELNEQTAEITKQITAIHKISSQTNLLSFNASIEAAHAGEAGKGFRIIANEVKKLSESTDRISAQISEKLDQLNANLNSLIETNSSNTKQLLDLQHETGKAVQMMADIRFVTEENTKTTQKMVSHLKASHNSISDTIDIVKSVEELNIRKVRNIEESGKSSVIQVNDQISFIQELVQIFSYLKENMLESEKAPSAE